MMALVFVGMAQVELASLPHTLANYTSYYANILAIDGFSGEAEEARSVATEARRAADDMESA